MTPETYNWAYQVVSACNFTFSHLLPKFCHNHKRNSFHICMMWLFQTILNSLFDLITHAVTLWSKIINEDCPRNGFPEIKHSTTHLFQNQSTKYIFVHMIICNGETLERFYLGIFRIFAMSITSILSPDLHTVSICRWHIIHCFPAFSNIYPIHCINWYNRYGKKFVASRLRYFFLLPTPSGCIAFLHAAAHLWCAFHWAYILTQEICPFC